MDTDSDSNMSPVPGKNYLGCCAGSALGCGLSFLISWILAMVLSALLAPIFGRSGGGNSATGILVSGLTCGASLLIGAGISFLMGRLFPIFKKKAR